MAPVQLPYMEKEQPHSPSQNTGIATPQSRYSSANAGLWIALAAIIIVALVLRLNGINWDAGYGYTPHPDERAILDHVNQLSFPDAGELGVLFDRDASPWNPGWFPYGSFPLYLLKLVQTVVPGDHDLRVLGRAVSALFDVGTVVFVYLLASRMYGWREGVLAAVLVAFAVIHIQLSHFFATDTILAFTTIAALFFMWRVATRGGLANSLIAGGIVGLGLATKVSQLPICFALVMAHFLYVLPVLDSARGIRGLRNRVVTAIGGLLVATGASIAVLILVQPYAFLDFSVFWGDVIEQSEMVRRIRDYPYTRQYIDTVPYLYQVRQLATFGLGWPLGVVAWAGLLYSSLRGMPIRLGVVYLAFGWFIPLAILLYSSSFLAIGVASIIALVALSLTLLVRSRDSRCDLLLLSWVVPYLLITGVFDVKFMRYLMPVTPILIIFGIRMLIDLRHRFAMKKAYLAHLANVIIAVVVLATIVYGISYTSIYQEPHTAVRMSEWINDNVDPGSVLLTEHWEEGIPNLGKYQIRTLESYNPDGPLKLNDMATNLAEADFVVFFSNRLYGTITRLPERYPLTSAYYRRLFSGDIGYQLKNVETAYPTLFGISVADNTYRRPGLPTPTGFDHLAGDRITFDLGFADESFSVYDHPMGLIFKNVGKLTPNQIKANILTLAGDVDSAVALESKSSVDSSNSLLLSSEMLRAQRAGGTWSEIINPDGLASRFPILAWLLAMIVIQLAVLPLTTLLFQPLPDRGYLFSKGLGILLVCVVAWLLASVKWVPFSFGGVVIGILVVGSVSIVALVTKWELITTCIKKRWRIIVVSEAVFVGAFLGFVLIRMANPDLWHPWQGGEKPMDLAYLNAVLKSTYMPPYDPWFAAGSINYYYGGQFIVSSFIRLTGIESTVAFNLAIPMFFALTIGGSFSIVYNLAESSRQRLSMAAEGIASNFAWSPVLAGLTGALFVAVIGNLHGAVQLVENTTDVLFRNLPFGTFDFWRSSRMMPPDPPGNEITEFPFFTFLFADLHAHLMVIPFTLIAIGLGLGIVLGSKQLTQGWSVGEVSRVVTLGIVVGAMRMINAWDYPTYLIVAGVSILLGSLLRNGGPNLLVIVEAGVKSAIVLLVGVMVFLPYNANYETFFSSLEPTTNQTVLLQFLAINGLFMFVVGSFFVNECREWGKSIWLSVSWKLARWNFRFATATRVNYRERRQILIIRLGLIGIGLVIVGFLIALTVVDKLGSTIPVLLVFVVVGGVVSYKRIFSSKPDSPHVVFAIALVLIAFLLAIGLDLYRLEGDIDRMNSVFKIYLQIWVTLALASAYFLWRLVHSRTEPILKLPRWKQLWLVTTALLIIGASVYPILGTQARLRVRFDTDLPLTLDGMAYMSNTTSHRDANGDIDLTSDYEAIRWIQNNIEGSPVMLEANTPNYRWGGRVSIYTGLPNIVGWGWHQEQQRWNYRQQVNKRIEAVKRIYETTSIEEALAILQEHDVEYIYVGQLERLYYGQSGMAKFKDGMRDTLQQIYENKDVRIFRVSRSQDS